MFSCNNTDSLTLTRWRIMGKRIICRHKYQTCLCKRLFYFVQGIRSLIMRFLIFLIPSVLTFCKDGQPIFIHMFFFIICIFPDKASLFPVFRNRAVRNFTEFDFHIYIEDKKSVRIEIIIHQPEYFRQFFLLRNIIQGITNTDNGCYRSV